MASFLVRVWLPDRPGALGLVASRIGAVRGEILGIEILERRAGRAVDELMVELPGAELVGLLTDEIRAVDGVEVDEVRPAPRERHDPGLDALETAALLVEAATGAEVLTVLVGRAKAHLEAAWGAVAEAGSSTVVVTDGDLPAAAPFAAVIGGSRAQEGVATGEAGPEGVAWAPLEGAGLDLVLGRRGRPLRARERQLVLALARIADLRWAQVAGDVGR